MKVVYIVSNGEGDYYSIKGIFSKRKLAELVKVASGSYNNIEVYKLDIVDQRILDGYLYWHLIMDITGKAGDIYIWDYKYEGRKNFTDSPILAVIPKEEEWKYDYIKTGRWKLYQWAKTKEEAIQIANEKRIKLIEKGEW